MIEVSGVYVDRYNRGDIDEYKISGEGDFFSVAAKALSFHYREGYKKEWKDPDIWLDIRCGYSIKTYSGYTIAPLNLEEGDDDYNLRQTCYLIEYYADYWTKSRQEGDHLRYIKDGLRGFLKVLSSFRSLTNNDKAAEVIEDCKSLSELLEKCSSLQDIASGDGAILEPFKSHPMSILLMYFLYEDTHDEHYGEAPWLRDGFR